MSQWHWLVIIIVITGPLWILYAVVKAAARAGTKSALNPPPTDGGNKP